MGNPTVSEIGKELAKEHVNWFLETIRPLLIEHFEHGFKHGVEINKGTWYVSTESLKERE